MTIEGGVIEACALVSRPTKPREYFMGKLLYGQCLGLLHGWTGIGKTWLSLLLATCCAGGADFMRYRAVRPLRVGYIDGEMLSDSIRERVMQICKHAAFDIQEGMLKFVSPDLFPKNNMVPNIADPEAQRWYDKQLGDRDVIIIDNLMSCSQRIGRDDDLQTWLRILPWLISCRVKGKCVVLVHHDGKGGSQLGTSVKEQVMDWILHLKRPLDHRQEDGACFQCTFEKGRNISGEDAEAFAVRIFPSDDAFTWDWKPLSDSVSATAKDMKALKMNDRDIAHALGISLYQVKKILADGEELKPLGGRNGTKESDDEMF